jgi:DNA-binding PadR family transcriptional regulator
MQPIKRLTKPTERVLGLLAQTETGIWGLEISKILRIPTGTVYPILNRLQQLGWVVAYWDSDHERVGPRRKYYRLAESALVECLRLLRASEQNAKVSSKVRAQHV